MQGIVLGCEAGVDNPEVALVAQIQDLDFIIVYSKLNNFIKLHQTYLNFDQAQVA